MLLGVADEHRFEIRSAADIDGIGDLPAAKIVVQQGDMINSYRMKVQLLRICDSSFKEDLKC